MLLRNAYRAAQLAYGLLAMSVAMLKKEKERGINVRRKSTTFESTLRGRWASVGLESIRLGAWWYLLSVLFPLILHSIRHSSSFLAPIWIFRHFPSVPSRINHLLRWKWKWKKPLPLGLRSRRSLPSVFWLVASLRPSLQFVSIPIPIKGACPNRASAREQTKVVSPGENLSTLPPNRQKKCRPTMAVSTIARIHSRPHFVPPSICRLLLTYVMPSYPPNESGTPNGVFLKTEYLPSPFSTTIHEQCQSSPNQQMR
ncbi:hypothetical protein B0T20DRAFT_80770 [Sordaria brevicollis]|uniref:Uncharacterized protein n=1 Tax=Sordaria brevicollis TaxID=83679 RepID=A0AAE0P1A7_SORBR|nr:hypothetical protein B0T20DRAFT_80770 [Sordaria brevicollis]